MSVGTFCCVCSCHAEPSSDARIGWVHACRHKDHRHLIPFVISEAQRDRLVPTFGEGVVA